MTITISKKILLPFFTLLIGFVLGINGTSPSNAETTSGQGEILNICINLKSGAIRASSKCDSKTERKTILGGVGAQGEQGPVGPAGPQGERGLTGATGAAGAAGSLSGLRSTTIKFFSPYSMGYEGCPRGFTSRDMTVLTSASVSTSTVNLSGQYQKIVSGINTTKDDLFQCQITVYVP